MIIGSLTFILGIILSTMLRFSAFRAFGLFSVITLLQPYASNNTSSSELLTDDMDLAIGAL